MPNVPKEHFMSIFKEDGSEVVKAISYKPEGRGSRPGEVNNFINLPNPSFRPH
jgi:hypothetical protein